MTCLAPPLRPPYGRQRPIPTRYSPFPTPYSLLAIPYSPLATPHSPTLPTSPTAPPPAKEPPALTEANAMTTDTTAGLDALTALFSARGLARAEPEILQPAGIFLDLSGEDIRRRLYLVQDPEGRELCLRPDYTIPVSRDHILSGAVGPAGYCYLGPVFRYRPGEAPGEILQGGVEMFGDADREAADADLVALALDAVRAFGIERPSIRLGDPGLFMAFVAALELPEPWPRRLRAAFGRPGGLADALTQTPGTEDGRGALLSALSTEDPAAASAAVEEMMAVAGISPVGGRSAQEIAERLLEKARLAADGGLAAGRRDVLLEAAAVSGDPRAALDQLSGIAAAAGIDVGAGLAAFSERLDLMAARGIDLAAMEFAADFGRRLDYYTGFVFEMYAPSLSASQIVGGGRYDRLLTMLGAREPVPAVGCSIWIDRIVGRDRG